MLTHTYLEPSSARPRERQRPQFSPSGQAPWFLVHVTRETERGKARGINAPAGEYVTGRAVISNKITNGSSLVCMAWSDRQLLSTNARCTQYGLGHTFASPSFFVPSRGPMIRNMVFARKTCKNHKRRTRTPTELCTSANHRSGSTALHRQLPLHLPRCQFQYSVPVPQAAPTHVGIATDVHWTELTINLRCKLSIRGFNMVLSYSAGNLQHRSTLIHALQRLFLRGGWDVPCGAPGTV